MAELLATFMAKRIIAGRNDYSKVIEARPDLEEDIDTYLCANGYENLIVT